jgi:hypothetical protein
MILSDYCVAQSRGSKRGISFKEDILAFSQEFNENNYNKTHWIAFDDLTPRERFWERSLSFFMPKKSPKWSFQSFSLFKLNKAQTWQNLLH